MVKSHILRCILTAFLLVSFDLKAKAAEIDDFTAAISKSRITLNPATVGNIDRFHFQYNAYYRLGGSSQPVFTDLVRFNGAPAKMISPDGKTAFSGLEYQKGKNLNATASFIIPFELFSIGLESNTSQQHFFSGRYLDFNQEKIPRSAASTKANQVINSTETTLAIGYPFADYTFGFKIHQKSITNSVKQLSINQFQRADDPAIFEKFEDDLNITGKTNFTTLDIGFNSSEVFGLIDVGVRYRSQFYVGSDEERLKDGSPKMVLSGFKSKVPATVSFEDFLFDDPTLLQIGIGLAHDIGTDSALQFLADTGSTGSENLNEFGAKAKGGNIGGGLLRFVSGSFVDISYGSMVKELYGFTYQADTLGIQFSFFEDLTVKISGQKLTLRNPDDKEIFSVTFPKISLTAQFGEPVQRAITVRPKQEKIRVIDRL